MNITVHIPGPLRPAFDGRRRVELAVPEGARLGDVLQTLFALYPKAFHLLPHEGPLTRIQLGLMIEPGTVQLREGQALVLVVDDPKRIAGA